MTLTSWIIDIALVLIVFRQVREERLTARTVLIPAALLAWAGYTYLRGFPTAGNDLPLIALFTSVGVLFEVAGGYSPGSGTATGRCASRPPAPQRRSG